MKIKIRFYQLLFIVTLIGVVASGCKKYPEGPTVSLRSKKERFANTWKLSKYLINGTDYTSSYKDFLLTTTKGSDYTLSYKVTLLLTFSLSEAGTWAFTADKREVVFNKTSPSSDTYQWQILKLKEDELWGRRIESNGDIHEIHLTGQ